MKLISYKVLIAILISLVSCGNNNKATESRTVDTLSKPVAESLPLNFYKRLEGTIANQLVVMQLQCYNGSMHGTYYYVKQGRTIELTGSLDSLHPNGFQLTESVIDEEENIGASLDCIYENGQVKGSWRTADETKNYLIDLKEIYPEGSLKFAVTALHKEIQAIPGVDSSPSATITKNLLIPGDDKTGNAWLSNQLVKIINGDSVSGGYDILEAANASNNSFAKDYEADLKEAKADGFDFSARFGYDDFLQLSVLYNENGFLIIDQNFYSFTGGAHGFGGDRYYCFNVPAKGKMQLRDILTDDSVQLQPILERAFRQQYQLKPTDSLTEILFENHLYPSQNFYFTSTGIAFIYLPYDVAPYAAGSVFVFVSFSDFRKYIQPWFAKRMNLN